MNDRITLELGYCLRRVSGGVFDDANTDPSPNRDLSLWYAIGVGSLDHSLRLGPKIAV